jgi:hypothetical protein
MTNRLTLLFTAVAVFAISSTSCVPLAVGAAAGYVAHDEGYRVQSPIKKTEERQAYEEENPNY